MLRVPAIATACREREPPIADPFLLRRRAFEALRELLVRIADRRRLVICIDDLQWADLDGALLLEELLRPPDAPALLTVVSFRSEEVAGKPFLRRLLEGGDRDRWAPLPLEPMTDDGSRRARRRAASSRFAAQRRRKDCGSRAKRAAVRLFWSSWPATRASTGWSRVRRPPSPRCSIRGSVRSHRMRAASSRRWRSAAGRWRPSSSATRAGSRARGSLSWRCSAPPTSFAAAARRSGSRRITIGFARCLPRRLPPTPVRRIHGLMVQALVERRSDDCEALFEHYRGAGDPENASIQAGLAAAKAGTALAFDRAAFFYRHALALTPASSAARAWKEGLANALANAGRPAEAAEAYLRAASRRRPPSASRAPAARGRAVPDRRATSIAAST